MLDAFSTSHNFFAELLVSNEIVECLKLWVVDRNFARLSIGVVREIG